MDNPFNKAGFDFRAAVKRKFLPRLLYISHFNPHIDDVLFNLNKSSSMLIVWFICHFHRLPLSRNLQIHAQLVGGRQLIKYPFHDACFRHSAAPATHYLGLEKSYTMPLPLSFVNERYMHLSFTWNETTFILGGYPGKINSIENGWDPSELQYHYKGEWMKASTTGNVPFKLDSKCCSAEVCIF